MAFTVLLIAARTFGEIALRLRQPSVVGEILAGVILGPSLLAGLVPGLESWLVPGGGAGALIDLFGLLGAMFLLLITGLETDIPLIRRHLNSASSIAAGGLILPFVGGLVVARFVPDDFLAEPSRRGVFAMFLATALAVSAIPVVAKVLLDLGLIRRTFGQTVLAAGMIDDTIAWILLSIIIAMASESGTGPMQAFAAALPILGFVAASFLLGGRLLNGTLALVQDRWKSPDRVFSVVIVGAFGFGAISQSLGIEAVLGAFVAGIIFGQSPRMPTEVVHRLHTVTLAAFAPVFFALAGLKVRIPELFTPRLGGLALVILAVAVVTKVAGAYVGARLAGSDSWSALGFGFALDARGAVGIIIASIGLRLDVFSVEVYSIVVLVAVVTSLIAAPMVSWCLQHVPLSADEKARLSRREGEIGFRRILVPVRPRPEIAPVHRMTARIVDRLGGTPSITMLSVASKDDRQVATRFIGALSDLYDTRPSVRVVSGERPVEAILEAASADIDLLILGAPEASVDGENLFDPLIDALARMAPCPTLIVAGSGLDRVQWPPHRVLFPTNGSQSSQRAAHLACSLGSGGEVVALNVVERTRHARTGASEPSRANRLLEAEDIVADVERLGSAYGVVVTSSVRLARQDPSDVIVAAIDEDIDIVVLATDLRPGSGRLHLGPTVEAILRRAPCPVVLINGL